MKLINLKMNFDGKTILDNINLSVKKGERIAILGGNGCGKTTLLNIINQGLTATGGKIDYEEFHLTNQNRCYIMQHETLPDELKTREALQLFAKDSFALRRGLALADKFGLTKNLTKRFSKLSGGEKQKLFLISSLQNSPDYFFLDEITTGLDYNSRDDLLNFLSGVFNESQSTLFLVTHYIEEALRLCQRFIIIKNGNIVEDLTKEQLIEQDYSFVRFNNGQECKILKTEIPELLSSHLKEIVSYERDYTKNLGMLISE
ncbi:MAG: ABC transporter ATP-binding protein [Streptococcaceae bacterium]|nr:ABC transporter ATP-binding protein [Streptococcaceae bacterium]